MTDKKKKNDIYDGITRRDALKAMGIFASAGFLGLPFSEPAFGAAKKPNIIFILSDDHRWDHMGAMGHPFLSTPAMNRLANEGVLFENAFVTTSLCSPSRASFLTGTYAHTHGVKNNITPWQNENVTLLELLKEERYDTAFIGKWHMPGKLPELRGVDHFITFTAQGGQGQYYDCPLIVNGIEEPSRKPYITEELTDRALEFIGKERENPFCLYLAHKAVHHQFLPPEDLKNKYDDVKLDLPKEFDPWITATKGNLLYGMIGLVPMHYRNYCEAIVAMDREIGRLLDALDGMGIADDTIVIYASDNGYFWGEHNLVDKRWPYEEAIRVPFIVRYPRLVPDPGRRADQMVLNVDLAPTLLEIAGHRIPTHVEGQSLRSILASKNVSGREAWLYEYFKDYPYRVPPCFMVRTKYYKYVEYAGRKRPELFNLVNDPKEYKNIYGAPEGEAVLPELAGMLAELKAQYGVS